MSAGQAMQWNDEDSQGSEIDGLSEDDPHDTDENGVRFDFVVGFPKEAEPTTEWVARVSADFPRPESERIGDDAADAPGYCGAFRIRREHMPARPQNFASMAFRPEVALETTSGEAKASGALTTTIPGSWCLRASRSTWKPAAKVGARKSVIVLTLPSYPERELNAKTKGFSPSERQRWKEDTKRIAMAFWRSLGFVRLGETLFFAWTRSVRPGTVVKGPVSAHDLDREAEIDLRRGDWYMLKR
ncbi:hypothetical protein CBER1_10779 [Cercospora berteroae]|uniref:Uncharacterized protein n=1 Tax=Cercospora berteroae TaxID=357750 RepID=A0A2S6CF73_9PEZI|nr:hypothetical protein CBER1_10779 [Cercospora berteroae]